MPEDARTGMRRYERKSCIAMALRTKALGLETSYVGKESDVYEGKDTDRVVL